MEKKKKKKKLYNLESFGHSQEAWHSAGSNNNKLLGTDKVKDHNQNETRSLDAKYFLFPTEMNCCRQDNTGIQINVVSHNFLP